MVALDARKLAPGAVGKADVQPLALALGQNGQARGGVGVLFYVRQQVIRHALEHLRIGRNGAGCAEQQEIDVKAAAAQLLRALTEQLRAEDLRVIRFGVRLLFAAAEDEKVPEHLPRQILELIGLVAACEHVAPQVLRQLRLLHLEQVEIADERRERVADVVRHGGDEVAVGLQRGLLVARALDDRLAHGVDVLREARKLVRARDGDGLVECAGRAHSLGQARDAPRKPPREAEGNARIGHERQHERADLRVAEQPRLGIITHGNAIRAVGKLHGIKAVAERCEIVLRRVVEQLARAPGAGLIRVSLRLIDDDAGVFLAAQPLLDGHRVARGDAVAVHILLQAALVPLVAQLDRIGRHIAMVDRPHAEPVAAEIAPDTHGQRQNERKDHARTDRGAPLFNQSDTPFPRRCGSASGWTDRPRAFCAA